MTLPEHPYLPGALAEDVADRQVAWPVAEATTVFDKPYLRVGLETIVDGTGAQHERVIVRPRGAVGVVALDDDDRILLVEQYRHPVGRRMIELPAGMLDVEGESPVDAAARELAEEADVVASTWRPLLDLAMTPGYSSERIALFEATGLSPLPEDERIVREAEEADMVQWWVPLADARRAVVEGRISDAKTVAGILAVART